MLHNSNPINIISTSKRERELGKNIPFTASVSHDINDIIQDDVQLIVRPKQKVQGVSILTHLLKKEITDQDRLLMQRRIYKISPPPLSERKLLMEEERENENKNNRDIHVQNQRHWVRKCPLMHYEISIINVW